mmetsp:Transcript_23170/g.46375  ORF Transcript_23170/g.46375 Transcript_23170/m.46375 type:complete len:357 (+) Transcript_23170:240-1310(+)
MVTGDCGAGSDAKYMAAWRMPRHRPQLVPWSGGWLRWHLTPQHTPHSLSLVKQCSAPAHNSKQWEIVRESNGRLAATPIASCRVVNQGQRRWTRLAPDSSYSCFDIHSCWKEPREARMEPPIQTENRRSCGVDGAMSLTFIDIWGTSSLRRPCSRSVSPGSREQPPLTMMLPQSSRRMSVSQPRIVSATRSGSEMTPSGTMEASSAALEEGAEASAPSAGRSHGGAVVRSSAGVKSSSGMWQRSHETSRAELSGISKAHFEVSSGVASVGGSMAQRRADSLRSRKVCSRWYLWKAGCVPGASMGVYVYSPGPTSARLSEYSGRSGGGGERVWTDLRASSEIMSPASACRRTERDRT